MGGLATPRLAIAVARAGGIGMVAATGGAHRLSAQLDQVDAEALAAPVGVNFLVPFLDRAALDAAAARAPFVELFWGAPDRELVAAARAGGALTGWQVGSADEARAAQDAGCDVVIAQGVEAGGHVRGTLGLIPLLGEVKSAVDLPVIAAGGIGTGRAIAAALSAGADGVRLGTRFMAATETHAHPAYVDALIAAEGDDTVLTTVFGTGWPDAPHRVLRSCIEAGEGLGAAQAWTPDWPTAGYAGVAEARALYAGQSVGAVRGRQGAEEIVAELVAEAEAALAREPRR